MARPACRPTLASSEARRVVQAISGCRTRSTQDHVQPRSPVQSSSQETIIDRSTAPYRSRRLMTLYGVRSAGGGSVGCGSGSPDRREPHAPGQTAQLAAPGLAQGLAQQIRDDFTNEKVVVDSLRGQPLGVQ